jgi:hypothetical protein
VLNGEFIPGPPPEECGIFSEFNLITPTRRGANEFRELGVALQQIRIQCEV